MRVVLDTATLVAAIRSATGASRQLLRAALQQRPGLTVLVSVPLLIEYEAVMTRAQHLKAARLSSADVSVLLDAVTAVSERVNLAYLWRNTLPDADDDMVLETAVNGGAEAIVTFNVRDFRTAARRFGIAVLLPSEALQQLEEMP